MREREPGRCMCQPQELREQPKTFSCVGERDYVPLLVWLISGDLCYRGSDIANYHS